MGHPPPLFAVGDTVCITGPKSTSVAVMAKVRELVWHHSLARWMYYLDGPSGKLSTRFWDSELNKAIHPFTADPDALPKSPAGYSYHAAGLAELGLGPRRKAHFDLILDEVANVGIPRDVRISLAGISEFERVAGHLSALEPHIAGDKRLRIDWLTIRPVRSGAEVAISVDGFPTVVATCQHATEELLP